MQRRAFVLSPMAAALAAAVPATDFEVWDVFTDQPYGGNPLAVVWLSKPRSDNELIKIAREFQHSETCFVVGSRQVRIFTPLEELPFAGHPVLGSAFALHRRRPAAQITLDIKRGPITVTFSALPSGELLGEMDQGDAEFGPIHKPEEIAPLLGLPLDAIATDIPIQSVSTGLWKILVPIKTLRDIRSVKVDTPALAAYCTQSHNERGVYLLTRETTAPEIFGHARNLFTGSEDAATGSAAGTAIAWLVRHDLAKPDHRYWLEQGLEISRPSRLAVQAVRAGNSVRHVRVAGQAILAASGRLV